MKSSQEASGLTAFVRCLNMKSTRSRLDISDGARFHQNVMYFQYPHLPWLNLVQRNAASNNSFQLGEEESKDLIKDWEDSAYNLFQLLRTLQCPYFYMLANHFSILFRAAGIGGRCEMHAIVTPTTRGFRQILKNDDIDFEMPLKSSSKDANVSSKSEEENGEEVEEEEEEDEIEFLESLGVEASQIKFKEDIKAKRKEAEDDNGDMSTIFIEGHDCQRFFNFILNDSKSIVTQVGRLAGIPPTLISPVAFHGGALRKQIVKTSKLRTEGIDFHSIELRGAILPHIVHTLCSFLVEVKSDFSLTMSNNSNSIAFTKSSSKLLENLNSSKAAADHYFGRENLSDCGLGNDILESLTRVDEDAVSILETLHYKEENGGFTTI
jgi:protein downstream neighbor of Son